MRCGRSPLVRGQVLPVGCSQPTGGATPLGQARGGRACSSSGTSSGSRRHSDRYATRQPPCVCDRLVRGCRPAVALRPWPASARRPDGGGSRTAEENSQAAPVVQVGQTEAGPEEGNGQAAPACEVGPLQGGPSGPALLSSPKVAHFPGPVPKCVNRENALRDCVAGVRCSLWLPLARECRFQIP